MAERRTYQGAIYERAGPGHPWTRVAGGQSPPPSDGIILDDPSRALRDDYTRARIGASRSGQEHTEQEVAAGRRAAERGDLTAEQFAALRAQYDSLGGLERSINEVEQLYRRDFQGRSTTAFGYLPGGMSPRNRTFNDAANRLMSAIASAQGLTAQQQNTPTELRIRFGPMLPDSTDSDENIERKLTNLRALLAQQRSTLSQQLGIRQQDAPAPPAPTAPGGAPPGASGDADLGRSTAPPGTSVAFNDEAQRPDEPPLVQTDPRLVAEAQALFDGGASLEQMNAFNQRHGLPPWGRDMAQSIRYRDRGGRGARVVPSASRPAQPTGQPARDPEGERPSGPQAFNISPNEFYAIGRGARNLIPFADEITGLQNMSAGIPYDVTVNNERALNAYDEQHHPYARMGGELAAGLALPVGRLTTLPRLMGGAAGYGFLRGAGEGEGGIGDRLASGAKGALTSATTAGLVGAPLFGLARRAATRTAEEAVPSVDQLRRQAGDLYTAAESRGVVAGPNVTSDIAGRIRDIARREELVTPTGRVSEAYPRAAEAMKLLDDYAGVDMNPRQIQVIRETLADAVGSTQGKERRIAGMMLRAFDEATVPLAPELEQARDVASRYLQAGQVQRAIDLAEPRAAGYTQSGYGNALRAEFRNLDRRMIRGQENFAEPVEDAIERVSRGDFRTNVLRNLGRLAPRGPVSTGMSAGVPFLIGNAIGGPGVGAAASAGTMAAGAGAQRLTDRVIANQARIAELLARNGGEMNVYPNTEAARRIAIMLGAPVEDQFAY